MGRPPEITDAELAEAIELIRKHGLPIAQVAKHFGQTRQAFYMRAKNHPDWKAKVLKAQSEHCVSTLTKLQEAAENKTAWQAYAWMAERLHGITDPVTKAKLEDMKKDRGQQRENAAKLRDFIERARDESVGTPSEEFDEGGGE